MILGPTFFSTNPCRVPETVLGLRYGGSDRKVQIAKWGGTTVARSVTIGCLLAAQMTLGCAEPTPRLALASNLVPLSGGAQGSFDPGERVIFFTCGCEPCREVAESLQARSADMVMVSIVDATKTESFAEQIDWNGEVWLDPGAAFSMEHRMASCPITAVLTESGSLMEHRRRT